MPGENFSRRVARAAAVGGGRSYRSRTPRGWFALLLVICLAGVALVAYSRYERTVPPPTAAHKPVVPPTTSNEWQAALAVDICGKLLSNAFPATVTSLAGSGWQSRGGGVVDLQPALATSPSQVEGAKATFASYFGAEGIGVSSKTLSIPGAPKKSTTTTSTTSTSTTTTTSASTTTTTTAKASKSGSSTSTTTLAPTTTTTTVPALGPNRVYTVGTSKCSGSPGAVVAELWQSPTASKGTLVAASKVGSLRFKNGLLLTVGFVAKGTASLPKPPGARSVQQFLVANPLGKVTQTITPSTITPSTITPSTTTGSTGTGSTTTASSPSPSSSSTTGTSKP